MYLKQIVCSLEVYHNHWVVIIYNLYCMQSNPHVHLSTDMNMDMIMCAYNDSRNHSNCRILT